MKSKRFVRILSFAVAVIFTTSTLPFGGPFAFSSQEARGPAAISSVSIPEESGKIEEAKFFPDAPFVVLIQDAHTAPDAQKSIGRILDHLIRNTGLEVVAVEGASSRFDPQLFRSFPEPEILQTVIERYFERNEMTGSAAASILSGPAEYVGIENWEFYESGLASYLDARAGEVELTRHLVSARRKAEAERQETYSEELFEADEAVTGFETGATDFLSALKTLAAFRPPAEGSELEFLLAEQSGGSNEAAFEAETRSLAREMERALAALPPEPATALRIRRFNGQLQQFKTHSISPEEFAGFLLAEAPALGIVPEISSLLKHAAEGKRRLAELEGTRVFKEWEEYAASVKESLFRNDEERRLDRKCRVLHLGEGLSRLELTRSQWEELAASKEILYEAAGLEEGRLRHHFEFYENATARDRIFTEALWDLLERGKKRSAAFVVGGFHVEGIVEEFQKRKVSYVVVRPAIRELPEISHYGEQMTGQVSWSEYFKIENGRIDFHSAYLRAMRDALLREAALRGMERGVLLKKWRDQILRDLASQGKTERFRHYRKWIDEAADAEGAARGPSFEKLEAFLSSLEQLADRGKFSPEELMHLIQPSAMVAWALQGLAEGAEINVNGKKLILEGAVRSELRDPSGSLLMRTAAAGAVAAQAAAAQEPEIDVERTSTHMVTEMVARFGRLEPDHEVQKYVEALYVEAYGAEEAAKRRIVILPEWNERNAAALPDGTILVAAGLLKFLEYPEEIKAVLAHETIHIQRNHALVHQALKKAAKDRDTTQTYLKTIGLQRLQEYEADIRWMVEDLGQKNINPHGFIRFIERFKKLRVAKGGYQPIGVVHGGWDEREILAESAFYSIDLESLSDDLGEIPAPMKTAISSLGRPLKKVELTSVLIGEYSQSEIQERDRLRIETADALAAEEVPYVLRRVYQNVQESSAQKALRSRRPPADEVILESLIHKTAEFFSDEDWPEGDASLTLAYAVFFELTAAIPYFFRQYSKQVDSSGERNPGPFVSPLLQELNEEDLAGFQSFEDLAQIIEVLKDERMKNLQHDVSFHANPKYFGKRLILFAFDKLNMKENPTSENMEKLVAFAAELSRALHGLYLVRGRTKYPAQFIFSEIMDEILQHRFKDSQREEKRELRFLASQTGLYKEILLTADMTAEEWRRYQRKVDEISTLVARKVTPGKKYQTRDYSAAWKAIQEEIQGKPVESVLRLFNDLENTVGLLVKPNEMNYSKNIIIRLFERAIDELPAFAEQSAVTAEQWRVIGMLEFLEEDMYTVRDYPHQRTEIVPRDPEDRYAANKDIAREDIAHLKTVGKSLEKNFMTVLSRENLIELYPVFYVSWKSRSQSLQENMAHFYARSLSLYLGSRPGFNEVFAEIASLEEAGVPVSQIIKNNSAYFSPLFLRLAREFPEAPDRGQLESIARMAEFISDPFLKSEISAYYLREIMAHVSDFRQRADIIAEKTDRGLFDMEILSEFIDKEAKKEDELKYAEKKLKGAYDKLMRESNVEAGIAAIISLFRGNEEHTADFIVALLKTGQSDADLKAVLLRTTLEYTNALLEENEKDQSNIVRLNMAIELSNHYAEWLLGMGTIGKFLLMGKLLTGERGLISNPKSREKFLKRLLDESIIGKTRETEEQAMLRGVISQVVEGLGRAETWKPLFFSLVSFLSSRAGHPPSKPSPWHQVIEEKTVLGSSDQEVIAQNKAKMSPLFLKTSAEHDIAWFEKNEEHYSGSSWRHEHFFSQYAQKVLRQKLRERGVLKEKEPLRQLTPLELTVEVGKRAGNLPVRTLQLFPQFADLSEVVIEAFSSVHDEVPGQGKLAMHALLEREWDGMWDTVEELGENLGGGSEMTVNRLRMKDGSRRVIKVLNPNFRFHLKRNRQLILEVVDYWLQKGKTEYEIAKMILEDVDEWILRDLDFSGALERDARFRASHDGYTEEGFRYKMLVPRSYAIPAKKNRPAAAGKQREFAIMEDEVEEGMNLTKWNELIAEGHDMKQIVSLITKNFGTQLFSGLVHSDIHPGNFRITPDGKIGVLDRNFLLELNPAMLEAIAQFMIPGAAVTAEGIYEKLEKISTTPVSDEARAIILKDIEGTIETVQAGNWQAISKLVVGLRKNGLKLPLEVRLILKNISSLQKMATRAGFENGILGAFFYVPEAEAGSSAQSRSELRDISEKIFRQVVFGNVPEEDLSQAVSGIDTVPELDETIREIRRLKEEIEQAPAPERNEKAGSFEWFGADEYAAATNALTERLKPIFSESGHRAAVGLVMPASAEPAALERSAARLRELGVGHVYLEGRDRAGYTAHLQSLGIRVDPEGVRRNRPEKESVGVVVRSREDMKETRFASSFIPVVLTDSEKLDNPYMRDYAEVLQEAIAVLFDLDPSAALLKDPVALVIRYGLVSADYEGAVVQFDGKQLTISALAVEKYMEWQASRQFAASA